MGKKDAELLTELDEVMQKLYEKHVPAAMREYIESREAEEASKPKSPPARLHHRKILRITGSKPEKNDRPVKLQSGYFIS